MMADPTSDAADGQVVNLSLVSHTNAGKTTLVRTLLTQDVGEVRDAAHVTDVATGYVMLQAGADTLMLWDTPGFGDTVRLLKRLRLSGNPLGWFLSQVWDRFRDRPLWSSQQAVRNVRDHADVVLYLVNASEDPRDAGYVSIEMEILGWIGKPIVLLLNQMGPPRPDAHVEEERWRSHLASSGLVQGSLPLDAFARCWVQEGTLLRALQPLLPEEKRTALARLEIGWTAKNLDRFRASMRVLADQLALAMADSEPVGEEQFGDKVRGALRNLTQREDPAAARAMAKLAERLDQGIRRSTDELIHLHGLSGRATVEVLRRVGHDYATAHPAKEGFAAILGGAFSGALGGLAADAAAGGLTLGGGMLVGSVLGAIGATGAARGYNHFQGDVEPKVRWSEDLMTNLVRGALLRYLAVAHFGRGRGEYAESEHPAFWQAAVDKIVDMERKSIATTWQRGKKGDASVLVESLEQTLAKSASRLLVEFYPDAGGVFA